MNQSELVANTCGRHQAQENAYEQLTVCFGFTAGWLIKWREIFKPVKKRNNKKKSIAKLLSTLNTNGTCVHVQKLVSGT